LPATSVNAGLVAELVAYTEEMINTPQVYTPMNAVGPIWLCSSGLWSPGSH